MGRVKGGFARFRLGHPFKIKNQISCVDNRQSISLHNCHAFEFYGDGCGQAVDAHGGSARLVVFEILGVNSVKGVEIALHVGEKNRHIDEVFPCSTAVFQYGAYIFKHRMNLRFEIEGYEVAGGRALQSGHTIGLWVAWANA